MLRPRIDLHRAAAVLFVCVACLVLGGFTHTPAHKTARGEASSSKELLRSLMRRSGQCKNRNGSQCCDHPLGLILTCIDYRIKLHELLGEDIGQFDVVRLPGVALSPEVVESIGLAVDAHHVRLVVVMEHSDCAMDRLAAQKDQPGLSRLQWHRRHFESAFASLVQTASLRAKISRGELLLVRASYDVKTNEVVIKDVIGDASGIEDVIDLASVRKR